MFEKQTVLRYPTKSMSLWRYVPYERLIDLLRSEELYFTHLPAFSDGLEGSLTNRTRERLVSWFKTRIRVDEASARELVRKYEEAQEDFYANCWHMNDFESYLMWKAYAERGFALRTTYERVQAAFDRFNGMYWWSCGVHRFCTGPYACWRHFSVGNDKGLALSR